MTKRLVARGSDGVVAILEGGTPDAALSNPLDYLGSVHFHSALDYMRVDQIVLATVNFPARARQQSGGKTSRDYASVGESVYWVGSHGKGFVPPCLVATGAVFASASFPIQSRGASHRYVTLGVDSANLYLVESWYTFADDLPTTSTTWKVFVFESLSQAPSLSTTLSIAPSRFIASRGKLDSQRRYIRQGDPADFHLPRGATCDVAGGGIRFVGADGAVISDPSYNGSFNGSGGRGCKI